MTFTLTSTGFTDGGALPDAQVHARGNRSPQLSWSGAPEGTKSFAITCFDPDAPTGSGFWHWTVANLPADVTGLAEGASSAGLPKGAIEGRTDFGQPGFGGAAPPPGHGPHPLCLHRLCGRCGAPARHARGLRSQIRLQPAFPHPRQSLDHGDLREQGLSGPSPA